MLSIHVHRIRGKKPVALEASADEPGKLLPGQTNPL